MSDETHRWIKRRTWQLGEARCGSCRRLIDVDADSEHLQPLPGPAGDDRILFLCPQCHETTQFHVEPTDPAA